MIGTYASALVICAAALALGRGILALTGEKRWNWLSPAIGFAALLAICDIAIRLPGSRVGGRGLRWSSSCQVPSWSLRRSAVTLSLIDGLVTAVAILAGDGASVHCERSDGCSRRLVPE